MNMRMLQDFSAGVTFIRSLEDSRVLTGSYDQSIRLFDLRAPKEAVKTVEVRDTVELLRNSALVLNYRGLL